MGSLGMNGFIIYYNTWERGTCVDFQMASHLFEAVVLFKRIHPNRKISSIRQLT